MIRFSPAMVVAGSLAVGATAAVAYRQNHNRDVASVKVLDPAQPYQIERLSDSRGDQEYIRTIQEGLLNEWGQFGPADEEEMLLMANRIGRTCFVSRYAGEEPVCVLQARLADVDGDYRKLLEHYPNFSELSSEGTWSEDEHTKGNTAILMQITTLDPQGRYRGVGGLLRDVALTMLPPYVEYALTITPEGNESFHIKSGAEEVGSRKGYKPYDMEHPNSGIGIIHSEDIIFTRYHREDGEWAGVKKHDTELTREPMIQIHMPRVPVLSRRAA